MSASRATSPFFSQERPSFNATDWKHNESWRKFNFKHFQPEMFSDVFQPPFESIRDLGGKVPAVIQRLGHLMPTSLREWEERILKILDGRMDFFIRTSLGGGNHAILVDIPDGTNSDSVFRLDLGEFNQGNAYFPVVVYRVGKNSRIKIQEQIHSSHKTDDGFQWCNSLSLMEIGEGAVVELVTEETHSPNCFHFRNLMVSCAAGSDFKNTHFYLGGFRGKTQQKINLNGVGARLQCFGLTAVNGNEYCDHETVIYHGADHTESSLLHKVLVKDRGHHVFTGNLHIPEGRKKATASQVNHNLSLDRLGRAESIPKLEIFSEDVRSSHGSTVGEIDAEQLFYLKARGLDEDTARHLLVEAFLSEILDEIGSEEERERIRSLLKEKIWPTKN